MVREIEVEIAEQRTERHVKTIEIKAEVAERVESSFHFLEVLVLFGAGSGAHFASRDFERIDSGVFQSFYKFGFLRVAQLNAYG